MSELGAPHNHTPGASDNFPMHPSVSKWQKISVEGKTSWGLTGKLFLFIIIIFISNGIPIYCFNKTIESHKCTAGDHIINHASYKNLSN